MWDVSTFKNFTIVITISKLMNLEETSKFLMMDIDSIKKLVTENRIPYQEFNGVFYFNQSNLLDWIYKDNIPAPDYFYEFPQLFNN